MKKPSAPLLLILALTVSFKVFSVPMLNSLPSANATIYLDFDGHHVKSAYWNSGNPFNCAPSGINDIQITEIFNRVAEDYRPFNVNITTVESKFEDAPLSSRIRIIVTPTSAWFAGAGGVAFIGSFKWGDDTPGFVFSDRLGPNNPKLVAECCSHESGHSVGLSHQSKYDGTCNLTATYNDGAGLGEASWAPIMGNSYYRNMSGWNNGPTPYGCANTQDNLSIITTQNGFTYRTDDYSDDINNNPAPYTLSGTAVDGIISTNTDKDAFGFNLSQNSIIHLDVKPFSVDANYQGANLDVKISLYNSSKVLLRTYDPTTTMNAVIDTVLHSGTYYLLIDGAGNSNIDDYGSLGSYSITSSSGVVLPIRSVMLNGRSDQDKHTLNWNTLSDETIKQVVLESSTDGKNFNPVYNPGSTVNNFHYTPLQKTDIYYRLKVTSVLNQSMYSNTILLKGVRKTGKSFTVTTFVQNEIIVHAEENYKYLLSNLNGHTITKGNGQAGSNHINMSRLPPGMYIFQLLNNDQKQTERIIKQ